MKLPSLHRPANAFPTLEDALRWSYNPPTPDSLVKPVFDYLTMQAQLMISQARLSELSEVINHNQLPELETMAILELLRRTSIPAGLLLFNSD